LGITSKFVPAEDLLIQHQLRLEALFKKLGAGERELLMQFAEGLMGLRSGQLDFFYDGEKGDEFDVFDFSGGSKNRATLTHLCREKKLGSIDPLAWHPAKSIYSQSVII
jgi:hypothetical protein